MTSQNPHDTIEFWIRKFTHQNDAWMAIWSHCYNQVESAMVRLCDQSQAGDRAGAIHNHMDWLLSDAISKGIDIPFLGRAKSMAEVYWMNKSDYEEAHNKADTKPAIITAPALKLP